MNMTVIATESGRVVAAMRAHAGDRPAIAPKGVIAFPALIANPGQRIYELVVPDELARLETEDLHAHLTECVFELRRAAG